PFKAVNCPGLSPIPTNSLWSAGYKIFRTKVLFPLPETPVIAVKQCKGIWMSIFFKLFARAPITFIKYLEERLSCGIGICICLLRYFAVKEFAFRISL